jgi:hypothetical protein
MNKSPHIVGGGLGTLRAQAREKWEKDEKARQERDRKAALARVVKASK